MSSGYQKISLTRPTARKEYRCIWCPECIPVGLAHVHEVSKFDGEFQDHRWHGECYSIALQFFQDMGEDIFYPHACKRGTDEEFKSPASE